MKMEIYFDKVGMTFETFMMNLKIVGAGHLGIRIGVLWKESFPDASIYLKTKHNNITRNELWQSFGYIPLSEEEENDSNRVAAPFVVFSAPLTNITDYAKEVQIAIQKDWDSNSDGTKEFVFTGSGGVYAENSGGIIDENSETKYVSQRSKALISAEKLLSSLAELQYVLVVCILKLVVLTTFGWEMKKTTLLPVPMD